MSNKTKMTTDEALDVAKHVLIGKKRQLQTVHDALLSAKTVLKQHQDEQPLSFWQAWLEATRAGEFMGDMFVRRD
jgi:murein L,D-transpeptidase YafK